MDNAVSRHSLRRRSEGAHIKLMGNVMLKTSMLAAVALLTAGSASAQEWSGFYVGGNVSNSSGDSSSDVVTGGAWAGESATLRNGFEDLLSASLDPEGTGFGVQAGYNWTLTDHVVVGVEGSYAQLGADDGRAPGQTATPFGPSPTYAPVNSIEADGQFNLRGSLGYDFNPLLAYVTFGYSTVDATASTEVLSSAGYSKAGGDSDWVGGFSYGVGAAMRFGGPWSARLEYSHTEYDDMTYDLAYRPGSTFVSPAYTERVTQSLELDTIQLGVNFHF